ncbi:SIR2 family NAD-dependent protein deacylase [Sulfuricurvum kujiense]|uniref:SIR2 family NAD-dependent protein deacylase n=1 Tax=Sulfuricurvum kujiense TaxID=148813 RepID=UPI0006747183|nr:Sir2 family NAD-dependent protein deacetylase [Sulfuricurvum kujiense]
MQKKKQCGRLSLKTDEIERYIQQASAIIESADAILITAGAGMGVDSGLPDFRGNTGFWQAYPVAKARGLSFEALANPEWFERDPSLAWAFYGHRLNLYSETIPHEGFSKLLELCHSKGDNYFILTSNVDGQFQKAGFDEAQICEIHGSIHHLQCTASKDHGIWSAKETKITVNMEVFQAQAPYPLCPKCSALARPNILMFGDWDWISERSDKQMKRFGRWKLDMANEKKKVAVIEIGAGTAIASIRRMSESAAKQFHTSLIRINPREYQGLHGTIKLPFGGLEGIRQILSI